MLIGSGARGISRIIKHTLKNLLVIDSYKPSFNLSALKLENPLHANHSRKIGKHSKRKYWESKYKF